MTASNMWALIIGGLAAGGVATGAVVWQRNHPDTPPAKAIAKLTEAPSLNPPKARPLAEPPAKPALEAPPDKAAGPGLVKGPPPKPEPASGHGEPPHFDVVRVEPSGDAVLAGKGDPNAKVALMSAGKVLAETKADANGQFVLMPPALKPGDHDLSLRQTAAGKPAADSKQNVAVSVPVKPTGDVVVALAEPGKPTKLISGPPEQKDKPKPAPAVAAAPATPKAPAAAAPPPKPPQVALAKPETAVAPPAAVKPVGPDLAIRSVEVENGTGFFASGVATAGTRVQIYLNEAHLAEVVAGRDHHWSLTVKRGLSAGHYIVRADASGEGRTVTARAEVPFDVPEVMAAKPAETETPKLPVDLAARTPQPAPGDGLPNVVDAPKPAEAEKPAEPPKVAEVKPNEPPADVAARMPREAPAAKAPKVAEAAETPSAASPSVLAPSTPPEPPATVPTPRPDVAAAAKAKVAAAPQSAPPVLAVAPPTPPEKRPTPPAAAMAVSPPRPAAAPPTIAVAPPTVAPPKMADIAKSAPVAAAKAVPSPDPAPAAPSPDAANAVIEQVETVTVVRGDNLWNISRDRLGGGHRYTRIYAANNDQIRDPKMIYPGQVFVMPSQVVAK